jgi:S1-C subfamily serine protease
LKLKRPAGALVASVIAGGPAARGGLKVRDLIVSVDGQSVDDPNAFDYRIATKVLGGVAQVEVLRDGKEFKLKLPLETAPELPRDEITIRSRSPFLGAKVANLSPALAEELRLDTSIQGVVVLDVTDGSLAQNYFRRGDIVVSINGERINRTRDVERLARDPSRGWRVTIVRGGQQITGNFAL